MAHSKVTKAYSANTGTANTFSYSGNFDVFKGEEVIALLDNVKLTFTSSTINESASPREYTVDTTAKTIHIGGADLSSGTIIMRPETDMGSPTAQATFSAGSSVTAADLNNNQLQLMRKAIEYDDQKLSSTGGTMTGDLTMGEDTTIIFEGATDDAYETTLTVTDPTADRTITLPNVTGTVVTTGDTATVTATMLAANSVDSSELVDGSIDTSHIAAAQVTTAKLAADAVTGAKLADDAVDSEHYTDGSIDTAHIADGQVTHVKLAGDAVDGDNIADDSINSEHYVDGSIDTAHIADLQVTTAKIAADAITGAKVADDTLDSEHYAAGSIDAEHLASSSVTTAKINADAVTGAKIADDAIDSEHLAADSIDAEHYAAGSVDTTALGADAVTGAKIADDAIDSEHYADGSIDTAHIAAAQVTDAKLASNAVTTAKITDDNVTTAKIADDAITIAKVGCEQTTISDSDSHIPTSGAVVDYVAAQIAPIGGLEVIATEVAFPTTATQPAAGVVISIADAGGVVFNGSGQSTTGRTTDGTPATVTINGAPSSLYGETLSAGVGMQVSSTGSSNIYNYHKILATESDVKQLSDDVNDFFARYRIASSAPGSSNDEGDLYFNTSTNKMNVYDGSAWGEVTSVGDYKILGIKDNGQAHDGTGPTFNGSNDQYDLFDGTSDAAITSAAQLLVSLNGVLQKPNASYDASGEGFALDGTDGIRFCDPPPSGSSLFITQIGTATTVNVPADGSVVAAKIGSGAVTTAKIADSNVTVAKMAANSVDSDQYVDGSVDHVHLAADAVDGDNIADDSINSEHYVDASIDHQHLANDCVDGDNLADNAVNSEHYVDGSIDTAHIADDQITLAKMASGTDGVIITYDASGNPVHVGPGTDGQVLTSTGAGSPPAFEDVASGGTPNNLIINGSMQIAQRGTSSTSNGYQTVDRFGCYSNGGTATWSVGTETSGTVWALGLRKYLRCTNTANATGSGNYREITYKIENQDVMDSGWNVASTSSKITLSFWVRASVGQVYYGRIRWMGDSADSNYIFSTGTLSADTWTKITKTIPGKSGKTVNDGGSSDDHSSVFQLNWSPFQGTDGTAAGTAVDQWNTYAGASKYPDFTTTWGGTNGATFDITGIQLEIGDSAGDFENRTYAEELARCQRYYYKTLANNNEFFPGMGMADTDGNTVILNTPFPVRMRSAPSSLEQTGTASDYKIRRSTTATCDSVPAFGHATVDQAATNFISSSHGFGDGSAVRGMSGGTDKYLAWSAEL